ncbi:DUF732 domain-containing protein [Mycolicibacterium phlei]|uniref:DUF732 domain-containing protein n=1 Tax=Mycolicibacterium phlei DSM 43239 = CCUG 21000 TaxID=1226750 RepID=A0A5N5V5J5_MYCPH|nr:DUF732 domain-containing protein [Mycolicibacterium phlei]KAB7757193.1 hypothetical protein MPHL21000_08325 [Mycolicibacterium phlei DSM 43239 = CCUG 21000]KXW65036.1 hypothetical protein MPHL43239_10415 [Mycolicibacterium phlei DSM 43239 = CCUG 21000]
MQLSRISPVRMLTAAAVGLMIAVAPMNAAPARADAVDDAFVAALQAAGVQFENSDMAKAMAKGFCKQVKKSTKNVAWAMSGLVTGGIPRQVVTTFAGEAAKAYCPDIIRTVTPW